VANTYLDIDTTTGRLKRVTATDTSSGATDGGKVVALASNGKIDPTLIDSTALGGGGDAIVCTEALSAGDWVNIVLSGGVRKCRKALATDSSKPAHGFVTSAFASGATATVYRSGTNTKIALTGFSSSDIGAPVFLSATTSGATTKTPPSSTGQLLQRLGYISDVNSLVEAQLDFGYEIIL
jgi:hypothetical protein